MMPIIEFANHHSLGSAFIMSDDSCKAMLRSRQPTHGSRECYANYGGMKDAVTAVCDYHYLDESIDFSRPIPQILKFDRWGEIVLDNATPVFYNYSGIKNLPTFTRTHVGKQVRIQSGIIYISLNPLEDCLMPSMEFLVGALVTDPDARPAIFKQALMMTLTNSRSFYIDLENEVQTLPDDNKYREMKLLLDRFTKFQISFFDQYIASRLPAMTQ